MFGVLAVWGLPLVDGVLGVVLPDVGECEGLGGVGKPCALFESRRCPGFWWVAQNGGGGGKDGIMPAKPIPWTWGWGATGSRRSCHSWLGHSKSLLRSTNLSWRNLHWEAGTPGCPWFHCEGIGGPAWCPGPWGAAPVPIGRVQNGKCAKERVPPLSRWRSSWRPRSLHDHHAPKRKSGKTAQFDAINTTNRNQCRRPARHAASLSTERQITNQEDITYRYQLKIHSLKTWQAHANKHHSIIQSQITWQASAHKHHSNASMFGRPHE